MHFFLKKTCSKIDQFESIHYEMISNLDQVNFNISELPNVNTDYCVEFLS